MTEHRGQLSEDIGRPADDEVIGTGEPLDDDFDDEDEIDDVEDEDV